MERSFSPDGIDPFFDLNPRVLAVDTARVNARHAGNLIAQRGDRLCMNGGLSDECIGLLTSLEYLSHRVPEFRGDVEPLIAMLLRDSPVTAAMLSGIADTLERLKLCLYVEFHPLPDDGMCEGKER
jgi:hypothetical protein